MQNNNVEQAEKQSASKIGKFNTADDLLAAYNALESEFTKRCQLIKQLQAELDIYRSGAQAQEQVDEQTAEDTERENTEQAATTPDTAQPVPEAEEGAHEIAGSPTVITADDVLNEILQNACEYAEVLCTIPEVMSACIASYKQRLIRPQPIAPRGCAVIVPTQKPRTLFEAKRLADALLSGAN